MAENAEPDRLVLPQTIAAKRARLDALRPLAQGSIAALERWYDVELTFTSNAVEGSTLTRSETAVVLEKGITVGGKRLRDHLEAIDHADALAFVRRLAASDERHREGDLREIHRLVLSRSNPEEAGAYSRRQRIVSGSGVQFPPPAAIPALMADFAGWLSGQDATPDTAFEAHYQLVTIHPFSDGNGRTARLLMNLVLLRSGWPPVLIGPDERVAYLDALEMRQRGGNPTPWRDLMLGRLEASLDWTLAHLDHAVAE